MRFPQKFKAALAALILGWAELDGFSQGTFQNLDFESAGIPPATPAGSLVPVTEAFPNWIAYLGANQQSTVLYNSLYLGTATEAILGPGSPVGGKIEGNYTAVLQAGDSSSGTVPAAIAQTGVIPATAKSIVFKASPPYASGWVVTIAGQNVPVVQISTAGFYNIYGGDISAFAGQNDELRFTALAGSPPYVNLYLDSISFSSTALPEPGTWALILCGAALFAVARRKPKA